MLRSLALTLMLALAMGASAQLDLDQVSAEIAALDAPITLTFWQTHNAEETETLRGMVEDFEALCPKIDVDMAYEPFDGARDKFLVSCNAGEGPDIMRVEIMWVAECADLGYLWEVTGFLSDEDREDFLPNTLVPLTYDGDIWGVPQVTDCLAYLYNRAMYGEAGLEPPTTWEELEAISGPWAEVHPGTHAFAFAISDCYFFLPFLWSFGGDMLDPDTREPLISQPEAVAGLEYVLHLQDTGVIPADFDIANDYNNRMEQLKSGQVGAIMNGPWCTADLLQGDAFGDPANLGVAPLPHREGGDVHVSPIGGHVYVISADCDEPEAAYLFIHWLTLPEQQARFAVANNLLPTRRSVYDFPEVQANPILTGFGEILATSSRTRPVGPEVGGFFDPLNAGFQAALRRDLTPAEALMQVERGWRELMGN
ncbi:extracellular solute-binding protein [Candidatus Sumerlaeota bacterium]|nr:extracellular solute-binding protein [Candidatus Sumerlaeota bacterium]